MWRLIFLVRGDSRSPAKTIRRVFADEPEDRVLQMLMERYGAESVQVIPLQPTTELESQP